MKKVFAFDIDGTLLAEGSDDVCPKVMKAIQILRDKGHIVGIATGRNYRQMTQNIDESKFDFIVLINGGYVKYSNKEIAKNVFTKDQINELTKYCKTNNLTYGVSDINYVYAKYIDKKIKEVHNDFKTPNPLLIDSFDELDIYQFMIYESFGMLDDVKRDLPYYEYYKYRVLGFDISLPYVAKNTGLEAAVNHCEMTMDDVVAFGDADNDVTMLKSVGLGIAMGNATDQLKDIADYVTADADDNGIINALIHYNFIEQEELL